MSPESFWFTRGARFAPTTASVVSVTPASVSETSGDPPPPEPEPPRLTPPPPPPPRLTAALVLGGARRDASSSSEPPEPPSSLSALVFSSLPLGEAPRKSTSAGVAAARDLSVATARAAATEPFAASFIVSSALALAQARYRSRSLARSGCTSTLSHVHASYGRPHHLISTFTFSREPSAGDEGGERSLRPFPEPPPPEPVPARRF